MAAHDQLSHYFPRLDDVPLNAAHHDVREQLRPIAEGKLRQHLLLVGSYGAGKTGLARLIPYFYYSSREECHTPAFINCANDFDTAALIRECQNWRGSTHFFNLPEHHWIILDDFDTVKREKQKRLRQLLETDYGVSFVLTANELNEIDDGVTDRCKVIEVLPPTPADFLPYAMSRLRLVGNRIPEADVLSKLRPFGATLRGMNRVLEELLV